MAGLEKVQVPERKGLDAYEKLMPGQVTALKQAATSIGDLSVLHINATPLGGGVAEMLGSQVRLERDLGLRSDWFVLNAPAPFFAATKKIHNLLQGRSGMLTGEEMDTYHTVTASFVRDLPRHMPDGPSVLVVHDPQPAPLSGVSGIPAILRLHIDLSTPNASVLEFLRPHIEAAERVVISSKAYITPIPWLASERAVISYPAIDPFTDKNRTMAPEQAWTILEGFGINPDRPLISQVSRFDPWKDPLGVIRAYYIAKKEVPDLQLLMAGFITAQDDPEAVSIFEEVQRHAQGDPDIYLFADPARLQEVSNDTFINAVYTASTAVIQKSIREGFGLTVTEAMWKQKPVIVGDTTGTQTQVKDEETGLVVTTPEQAAEAIVRLCNDANVRKRLGSAAHESVKARFLMPRLVSDFVSLYRQVTQ